MARPPPRSSASAGLYVPIFSTRIFLKEEKDFHCNPSRSSALINIDCPYKVFSNQEYISRGARRDAEYGVFLLYFLCVPSYAAPSAWNKVKTKGFKDFCSLQPVISVGEMTTDRKIIMAKAIL